MKKLLLALCLLPSLACAQAVQQSGQITPGHVASWITTGVIGDGGVPGGPIFTGSTTQNDFACVGSGSPATIIDCGLSAVGINAWIGLQNFNGGATAPTRSPGDSTTNVATTAFVMAAQTAQIGAGVANNIAYYAANGNVLSATSALPIAVQNNITRLGAINITSSAPNFDWYNSVDISHAGDFGTPLMQIIAEGTQNAFVAQAIQDQPTESFLTAVTGYGRINVGGSGNYVYGLFGKVSVNATNGSATNEVDCENLVADSPNTFPYTLGFPVSGAYCVGLQSINIGAKKGHTAFYSVSVSAPWRVSFYAAPTTIDTTNPTSDIAGIWIDATAIKSPINSAIFKNTGLGSNVPVIIQTLGTYTKANAVLNVLDLNANVVTQFRQDGGLVTITSPSAASTDPLAWSLTNNSGGSGSGASASMTVASTSSGSGSGANFFATTSAGTLTFGAASSALNTASFRWTGIGTTFFDAQNAAGNMAFRTGTTPTNAITISAAQLVALPAIPTSAGGGGLNVCVDTSGVLYKKSSCP